MGINITGDFSKKNDITEFEKFWNLYDKKVGDKKRALRLFQKLTKKEKSKIFETLEAFKSSISNKQYLPYPTTYLNQKRWNDELEIKSILKADYKTTSW